MILRMMVRRAARKGLAKLTRGLVRGVVYPAGAALLAKAVGSKTTVLSSGSSPVTPKDNASDGTGNVTSQASSPPAQNSPGNRKAP